MSYGLLLSVGIGDSVMAPPGVIRPILLPPELVNHTLPSGAEVMPFGWLVCVGMGYSVIRLLAWAGPAAIPMRTATDKTAPTPRGNLMPSSLLIPTLVA